MFLGKMIYSLRVFLVHPGVKMVNYQRTVMEAWKKMLEKEGGGGEGVILLWISILFRS